MKHAMRCLIFAGAFLFYAGSNIAQELDVATQQAVADVQATGAAVAIGSAPDFKIEVEHDTYRVDDPIFEALPKLEKLRSLTIGYTKRARDEKLMAKVLKRLEACKQLEALSVEFPELEQDDLLALDALPKLKSLSIRVVGGDPMADICRYLERPEAAKLESIGLQLSEISDGDCTWLAAIPNLREFNLRASKMSISEEGLSALAKKGNLRSIGLHGSKLAPDDLPALTNATDLESLDMTASAIGDDDLAVIAQFKKLRYLNISLTEITGAGLQSLRGMTSLEALDVQACKLGPGSFKSLASLTRLKQLKAYGCDLDNSDAEVIGSFTNLESLDLNGNSQITHDGIAQLGKLTNLKSLSLQGLTDFRNGLNDFENLTKLERLYVSSESITPLGIKPIANFHNLQDLDLSLCPIGDGGLEPVKNLKSLRSLGLRSCSLQDRDLANLAGLKDLQHLYLEGNNDLTDAGIANLAGLTNLLALQLRVKNITQESCRHLQGMTRMQELYFGASTLNDAGMATFANMPGLYRLHLSGVVTLNEAGLESLKQIRGLHILSMQLSKDSRVSLRELAKSLPDTRVQVNGKRFEIARPR